MKRNVKAVFFDAGETILSVAKNRFERIQEALSRRGFVVSIERIQEVDAKAMEILLGSGDSWISRPEQEERFWDAYYRMMVEGLNLGADLKTLARELWDETYWVKWCFTYPDVLPVLKALKGRYKLGVISNAFPSMYEALDFTGLTPYMDSITISAEVGVSKPDPLIYEIALRSVGVKAEESIFVDNLKENTQAAAEMGFKAFLIDRDGTQDGPEVIRSLYAVLDFLEIPR